MMLNERLIGLLEQSIEEYIRTAAPVASNALADRLSNARSPATIRNDLRILEQLGYLHQVHSASGGRIPTARAYQEYAAHIHDPTFVNGLITDLCELSTIIERIERKLGGGVALENLKNTGDTMRRINAQTLFNDPQLMMSAIYLIIKEKLR